MAFDVNLNDPRTQKIIAGILFLIIGLYLVYNFMISPQSEKIEELRNKRNALDQEVKQLIQIKKQLPKKKEEIKNKKEEIQIIKDYLPSKAGFHTLLKSISELSADSNLSLSSINFGKLQTKNDFKQFDISLKLEGTYHNLGGFLSSLSKLPRIVNVGSIKLTGINNPEENFTISVNLNLISYVSKGTQ
ncbi:MAG: type 4a pilus biogenesis protein PilO [Candidatus Mcinerneyibacterium aminivorans]|jgi:type IV pilus assembly protein PilO|uniref:Type 4a pilus biogenesis protein PilO n=1 Tax=Candidatus Mcinerneyibacterium aminivorans TaxID=2703815 RepID=A0A5D0MC99_9BACT|nr:MAG: type 4a pilus biogenesis protein PilO [Candidatus Mcinerneyibacterium aminivorans]